ncbi:MAG: hypothetical protein HY238_23400, partial [Acidobacteria bacterium]|nr:hypothetical protein [Acidobacteriota bacterium]
MRTALLIALAAFVLACYAWSLWRSPSFGRLADQAGQLALARDYHRALEDGDFPPRWAATANGGRGSPAFVLYAPLFAALTSWIALAGRMDVREAMRWAVMLVVLATGASIYYLARAFLTRFRSLLAAGIVLLLPGSTFICLGRGMYPQFFAVLWVALLAGAGLRIVEGRRVSVHVVVLILAGAGLILTHTVTTYLVLVLLLVLLPLLWPALSPRRLAGAGLIVVAVLLATAWFWIPQLYARSYARPGYLSERHNYLESTLLGPAGAGAAYARDWRSINQIGRMIVVAQVVLAFALAYAGSGSGLFLRALPWVAGFSFLAFLRPAAVLLMKLPGYGMVQFCWRWQILLALFCGVALAALPAKRASALPVAVGLVTIAFFT